MSKLKAMPLQSWLRVGAVLAAVVALVWAGLSRGLFDGVTLAIAIAALGLALLQRLPARPQLSVVPRTGDQLTLRHDKELRPFDEDQIVREQVHVCEGEMPRMPKREFPPDGPLAMYLASADAGARVEDAINGVSDSHLRAYMEKVSDYSIKLRKWLEAVDAGRADRVRVVEGRLRIQELGRAPADHVRLRMRFPAGFDIDEELPKVPQPPRRPHFEGSPVVLPSHASLFTETYLGPNVRIRLPGTDSPDYTTDDGRVVVTWDLGRVNQSERRDVPPFSLKAAPPGTYSVKWEITAEGLAKPLEGELPVVVEHPTPAAPIATLGEVEEERRARELAFGKPNRPRAAPYLVSPIGPAPRPSQPICVKSVPTRYAISP